MHVPDIINRFCKTSTSLIHRKIETLEMRIHYIRDKCINNLPALFFQMLLPIHMPDIMTFSKLSAPCIIECFIRKNKRHYTIIICL